MENALPAKLFFFFKIKGVSTLMHLLIAAVMVSSGKKGEPAVTQHVNFRRSHCTHCPLQKHQAEAPT